jgi:hypothetical protein
MNNSTLVLGNYVWQLAKCYGAMVQGDQPDCVRGACRSGGYGLVGKLRESSDEAIFLAVYPSIGFAGVRW